MGVLLNTILFEGFAAKKEIKNPARAGMEQPLRRIFYFSFWHKTIFGRCAFRYVPADFGKF